MPYSHCGSLSLSLSLSIPLFFFVVFLSLSLSIFFFFWAAFHVTPPGRGAEGGLMASLSGVFAAVSLQLLGCDKESKEEKFSH